MSDQLAKLKEAAKRLPNLRSVAQGRVKPSAKINVSGGIALAIAEIDTAWAIEPRAADGMRKALERIDLSAHATEFAAGASDDGDGDECPYVVDDDGTATLQLAGVMTKRPVSWGGNTSTVLLRRAVRLAGTDERVKRIALIVDSPGGQVAGTADLADDIKAMGKPIGAYIEDCGCSAAYWVASQCDFVYCNRTAQVGSIGTLLVVEDTSKQYADNGVTVHVIGTGAQKGAGVDGSALTEEQLADFQRLTQEINSQFVGSVAAARKLAADKILNLEAAVFIGANAVKKGLVDKVATLDEFFARLGSSEPAEVDAGSIDPDPDVEPDPDDCGARGKTDIDVTSTGGIDPATTAEADSLRQQENDMSEAQVATPPAGNGAGVSGTLKDIHAVLSANGITSADQVKTILAQAKLGREYEALTREDAQDEAIRALGVVAGTAQAAYCANMPIETVIGIRDAWRAQADYKFGVGTDGQAQEGERLAKIRDAKPDFGAVRRSAGGFANAVNAEHDASTDNGSLWAQLPSEIQAHAKRFFGCATSEKQEAYAKTLAENQARNKDESKLAGFGKGGK